VSLLRRLLPLVVVVMAILAAGVVWFALGPVFGVIAGLALAVLEMVCRVAAAGKTELSSRPEWPTRLRSPSVLLISLGLVGVWLVYQTLLVSPRPPPSETPGIAFAVRDLYPRPEHGFRIDVHLKVPSSTLGAGCANPVEVTAIISGTPELWKQAGRSLDGRTDFGIGVLSSSGAVYDMEAGLAGDATAPLDPYGGFGRGASPINRTVKATFRPAEADRGVYMVSGSIERWASSWIPLVVTFKADWVQRRSFGSCYVRLPSLTGNAAEGARGAVSGAIQGAHGGPNSTENSWEEAGKRVASSYGRIRLEVNADLLGEQSAPRPTAFDAGQSESIWTCSSSALDTVAGQRILPRSPTGEGLAVPSSQELPGDSGCGGFAVVSSGIAQPFRELALIALGVIISIGVDIAYSEIRGRAH
jgi:hypothetical protein